MEFLFGHTLSWWIQALGYTGVFVAVFAESGMLIGFFLPGDSLLFTAGFLASQGYFNIFLLAALALTAAVAGDSVGYLIGEKAGPRLFTREKSLLFRPEYIERTREFYERHGGKAIILARFVPIVRAIAPVLAGVGKMRYSLFLFYNLIGAVLWGVGITLLGYTLGRAIPNVDRYLLPLIALIIMLSFLPGIFHILKSGVKSK